MTASSEDYTLSYFESGVGTTLVLLHAFPLDADMWDLQTYGLDNAARVIAANLPDFGSSPPGQVPFSIESAADSVARFLPEIRAERIVLGGISMGGYIAMAFARRYPELLEGLILADTRADADDAEARGNRDALIALVREKGSAAVVERMLPKLLSESTRESRPVLVESVTRIGTRQSPIAIANALAALRDRPDATADLARITVPTLVLVGEHDVATPPRFAEAITSLIPGSRLEVVPGAGHLSNMEAPAYFNDAVRRFLSSMK